MPRYHVDIKTLDVAVDPPLTRLQKRWDCYDTWQVQCQSILHERKEDIKCKTYAGFCSEIMSSPQSSMFRIYRLLRTVTA